MKAGDRGDVPDLPAIKGRQLEKFEGLRCLILNQAGELEEVANFDEAGELAGEAGNSNQKPANEPANLPASVATPMKTGEFWPAKSGDCSRPR